MTDDEFMSFMTESEFAKNIKEYLNTEKVFIKNPERYNDVIHAKQISEELFQDSCKIAIDNDPLQLGSLILCINGYDVTVQTTREMKLFKELISKADNFEIRPIGDEKLEFSIMFNDALTKLPQVK